MADEKEGRKYWMGGYVEEIDWIEMHRIGSKMGAHPSELVKEAIHQFIANFNGEEVDEKNTNRLLRELFMRFRENRSTRTFLKQIAYEYVENQSDENAEILAKACELAGIDAEVLLDGINQTDKLRTLISSTNSRLREAQIWLLEYMRPNEEYPAKDILEKADRAGIIKTTLDRAKSSLGIRSERRSMGWIWSLPPESETPGGGENKSPF